MEAFKGEQLTSQEKEASNIPLTERKEIAFLRKVAFWVTLGTALLFSALFIYYGFYFFRHFTEPNEKVLFTQSSGLVIFLTVSAAFPLSLLLALPRFYGSPLEKKPLTVSGNFFQELLDLLREYLTKKH